MTSEAPLFWRSDYARIQSPRALLAGIDKQNNFTIGLSELGLRTWMVLDVRHDELRSPCRATFGGFWSRLPACLVSDAERIISQLSTQYQNLNLSCYLAPEFLEDFSSGAIRDVLHRFGATAEFEDLDYWIDISGWSEASLSKGNRKKLRQWRECSGRVDRVSLSDLEIVYEVIRLNRLSLGVTPSISLDGLRDLIQCFPEEYELYLATVDGQIAASAIAVNITPNSKYVFFWADMLEWRPLSPVVAVCQHLVDVCRDQGRSVLDLGISTEHGEENLGLMRFKANLGACPSSKFQLRLKM